MKAKIRTRVWLYLLDTIFIVLAGVLAYVARFENAIPQDFLSALPWIITLSVVVYLVAFTLAGAYRIVLRYVGVETALRLAAATVIAVSVLSIIDAIFHDSEGLRLAPFGVLFIQAVLVFVFCSAVRLFSRVRSHLASHPIGHHTGGRRTLIVGGGSAGSLLLRDIEANPSLGIDLLGFLDDDPSLQGLSIRSVPVIGTIKELPVKVRQLDIAEIIIALPSASPERIRELLNLAAGLDLTTQVVPPLVIEKGSVSAHDLRKVEVEDLLGREQTPIDVEQVASTIKGKVVAVTGAAGSIGSELCRQIMKLGPKKLLLIEIDESRLYELWLELGGLTSCAQMCLCDITESDKLHALLKAEKPELVLHAAAYKHVPLLELAPDEAIRVNVGGTKTLIEACEASDVDRFVLISTDKAVAPASVMGATKSIAELLMAQAAERGKLNAVAVRFGNVLGSRGSVVPLFEEQLRRGGPVLVTHEDITRYFMTIPEAARLVLQAQAIGERGDIFVLEMGEPVKITDLAKKMIALSGVPAEIEIVGLRPAEKLHEVLTTESESLLPTPAERINKLDHKLGTSPDFDIHIEELLALPADGLDAIRPILHSILPDFSQNGETTW